MGWGQPQTAQLVLSSFVQFSTENFLKFMGFISLCGKTDGSFPPQQTLCWNHGVIRCRAVSRDSPSRGNTPSDAQAGSESFPFQQELGSLDRAGQGCDPGAVSLASIRAKLAPRAWERMGTSGEVTAE